MLYQIKAFSEEYGLYLHPMKTKAMQIDKMQSGNTQHITIDNNNIEFVYQFYYLGCMISNNHDDSTEVRRRVGMTKSVCLTLNTV